MSDTVILALIALAASVFNSAVVIVTMVIKEHFDRDRSRDAAKSVAEMATNVERVHLATNSMKDELIRSTEKEAHARGSAEGIILGRAEEKAIESEEKSVAKSSSTPGVHS